MEYPNLEALGVEIQDKCRGCTNLDTQEAKAKRAIETGCRQLVVGKKAADAVLKRSLELALGDQTRLIDETRNDYLKDTLKLQLQAIISQSNRARDLQFNCPGAEIPEAANRTNVSTCRSPQI